MIIKTFFNQDFTQELQTKTTAKATAAWLIADMLDGYLDAWSERLDKTERRAMTDREAEEIGRQLYAYADRIKDMIRPGLQRLAADRQSKGVTAVKQGEE